MPDLVEFGVTHSVRILPSLEAGLEPLVVLEGLVATQLILPEVPEQRHRLVHGHKTLQGIVVVFGHQVGVPVEEQEYRVVAHEWDEGVDAFFGFRHLAFVGVVQQLVQQEMPLVNLVLQGVKTGGEMGAVGLVQVGNEQLIVGRILLQRLFV